MIFGRRMLVPLRQSPRQQAVQAALIEKAIADGNMGMQRSATDRSSTRDRVTVLESAVAVLQQRPVASAGKKAVSGLKGLTTVTVPLVPPMPDADYVPGAALYAPGGVLLGAGGVTAVTALAADSVTVQLSLGTVLAPASCTVCVTAVKGG